MVLGLEIMNINKKPGKKINKKGYYFTMDALFASIILVGGLLLISQHLVKEHPRESIEYLSSDLLIALSELGMDEINSTFFAYLETQSNNTDGNLSVLEQIGTYWAADNPIETLLAMNLSEHVLRNLMPNNTGMNLVIEGDTLFEKPRTEKTDLRAGERMITGIMKGAPVTGATSSAYLRKIDDKRTSSFAYFGGFVGEGNISVFLKDIPDDVSSADITRMTLELDAGGDFTLEINGDTCDSFNPTTTNMTPDVWDITYCNASIASGTNLISLIFNDDLNKSYVAGGYLRVDYKTNELQANLSIGNRRYNFPGIDGVANLYDSFYIPGTLTNMSIYLHFEVVGTGNTTTYLTIGDTYVYRDNVSGEIQVYINDTNLTNFPINLNYDDISNRTIPLRFASYNESYLYVFGTNADVVLITDLSGSMKYEMGSWAIGNAIPGCKEEDVTGDKSPKSRRLGVAACLD